MNATIQIDGIDEILNRLAQIGSVGWSKMTSPNAVPCPECGTEITGNKCPKCGLLLCPDCKVPAINDPYGGAVCPRCDKPVDV